MPPFQRKAVPIAVAGLCAAVAHLVNPTPANASLVTPCVPTAEVAVDSCTIEFDNVTYQISKVTGSFNSLFPSPSTTSPGFWWKDNGGSASLIDPTKVFVGDITKARSVANLIGKALGFPNTFSFVSDDIPVSVKVSPFFAFGDLFGIEIGGGIFETAFCSGAVGPLECDGFEFLKNDYPNSVFATATPFVPPVQSVPGPLPILGASVAFGFSRKLRKRIKHRNNSVSTTLEA